MKPMLETRYEVVYYAADGRRIYWPADDRSDVLAEKLRECQAAGHENARLAEASRP